MVISSEVIALGALVVAILSFVFGRRKDATQSAADFAKLSAQLDSVQSGVDELRVEMRTLRGQVSGLSERIAKCESRLDTLEKEGKRNDA